MLVLARFTLSPEDIIKMSRYSDSSFASLSFTAIAVSRSSGKQKTLLTFGKQGLGNPCSIRYLPTMSPSR